MRGGLGGIKGGCSIPARLGVGPVEARGFDHMRMGVGGYAGRARGHRRWLPHSSMPKYNSRFLQLDARYLSIRV